MNFLYSSTKPTVLFCFVFNKLLCMNKDCSLKPVGGSTGCVRAQHELEHEVVRSLITCAQILYGSFDRGGDRALELKVRKFKIHF